MPPSGGQGSRIAAAHQLAVYAARVQPVRAGFCARPDIWGSGGMSWDAKGVLEAKVSRDTRCPGQSPSWDGVGCPRTPRVVPGHLRCPRTVLSQDGQLSWDGRRRSRTALLGHQVSQDTTCPRTFFSAPERPPLTPDGRFGLCPWDQVAACELHSDDNAVSKQYQNRT